MISRFLENKYLEMKNFHETVLRIPVLCDPFSFNNETKLKDASCCPIISYCAHLSAYLDDARLVIESVAKIGLKVRLKLIGPITHRDRCYLQGFADHACLGESIEFISNISRLELMNLYLESSVLIAPISNDEASLARFPSKIVDYMMSGRPIVTSAYGEPSFILEHLSSAYIAQSHTSIAYAEALRTALLDSNAGVVGRRGRSIALQYLNYKLHAKSITQFFQQLREVS